MPFADTQKSVAQPLPAKDSSIRMIDDIKVKYHPSSQRPAAIYRFEDYIADRGPTVAPSTCDPDPWHPFASRLEFEFAELTHQAGMNHGQIDKLLGLIERIRNRESSFDFHTSKDVRAAWDKATLLNPNVSANL